MPRVTITRRPVILPPFNHVATNVLPWALHEQLQANGGLPDTKWADELTCRHRDGNLLYVLEPLPEPAPHTWSDARPWCCYSNTVIFYWPRYGDRELARLDYTPRTWPSTHFVEHDGQLFMVGSASIRHVFDRWHVQWYCARNEDWCAHFEGRCFDHCRVCQIVGGPAVHFGNHHPEIELDPRDE